MKGEEPPHVRRPLHHSPEGGEWSPSPSELGEDFGSAAVRLAGFCSMALGWSPDQFWSATPAEVRAVAAVLAPVEARAVDGEGLASLREALGDG